MDGLTAINERLNVFRDIRGVGLLLGCELSESYAGRARDILIACTELGLLTLVAGPDVLRLAPPLNISEDDINEGLAKIEQGIRQAYELS